ncbi:hypothetical protein Ndes2526B_g00811 [Nannochloris sp. 'desiccata']
MQLTQRQVLPGSKHVVSNTSTLRRNGMNTHRTGRVSVTTQAVKRDPKDPKNRVVITGMGVCSVFGNDPEVFYEKLLAGVSGIDHITRFDASEFPTNFGGQIKDFDNEGLVDKKNARRYDDCLSYTMVASKKALRMAGIEKEANPEGYEKTR